MCVIAEGIRIESRKHVSICRIQQMYCQIGQNGTRDVIIAIARRDHRKSKFGLRQATKLNELYGVTKSEF